MPKRATTEDHLATLRELRNRPADAAALAALQMLIATPRIHGIVLKLAADLAQKWEAKTLAATLVAAAQSAAGSEGPKRDPGCEGKSAALRALIEWDAAFADFYAQAARWRQMEPVQNKSIDTAAECRGLAAIGLASCRPEGALPFLVDLLVDPEPPARLRAAMALAIWSGAESVALLRLKALLGDEEADVTGEVLASLLKLEPAEYVPFVAKFLGDANPRIVEAAALALGQSRRPESLAPLIAAWTTFQREPIHTSLLMAIALLRTTESLNWLLYQLAGASATRSADIRDALAIYRGNPHVEAQIKAVLEKGQSAGKTGPAPGRRLS